MKQILLICFLLLSLFTSAQERVEKVYWDCTFNSMLDKGVFLKKQIKQYENYLIEKNFLKDSTAQSYYDLFKSFEDRKSFPSSYSYSFFDSIKINSPETKKVLPSNKKCISRIKNHEGYKEFEIKANFAILLGKKNVKHTLKHYIDLLDVSDFELDYYRIKTLLFTQILNFTVD